MRDKLKSLDSLNKAIDVISLLHIAIIVKAAVYRRRTSTFRVFSIDILGVKQVCMLQKGMGAMTLSLTITKSLHWRENLQVYDFGFMD